jgi:hypothetical protein
MGAADRKYLACRSWRARSLTKQVHFFPKEKAMASKRSIDHLIRDTPSGVVVDLKRLFVYPDGHIHLTFKDDTNWPANDAYEAIEMISGDLLRHMQKKATAKARRKAQEAS